MNLQALIYRKEKIEIELLVWWQLDLSSIKALVMPVKSRQLMPRVPYYDNLHHGYKKNREKANSSGEPHWQVKNRSAMHTCA